MDLNLLRSIVTVLMLLMFVGIALWAYSRKRQDGFNEAAQLALVDDHPAHPLNGDRQ